MYPHKQESTDDYATGRFERIFESVVNYSSKQEFLHRRRNEEHDREPGNGEFWLFKKHATLIDARARLSTSRWACFQLWTDVIWVSSAKAGRVTNKTITRFLPHICGNAVWPDVDGSTVLGRRDGYTQRCFSRDRLIFQAYDGHKYRFASHLPASVPGFVRSAPTTAVTCLSCVLTAPRRFG